MAKVEVCINHYVIVRSDLPFGSIVAQAIHAAGETGPVPPGTYAIALAASDEQALAEIEARLLFHKIPHVAIREPDLGNSLTAIGLFPVEDRRTVRRYLKGLRLLGDSDGKQRREDQ